MIESTFFIEHRINVQILNATYKGVGETII